jgi:signal transduction histidine kinase
MTASPSPRSSLLPRALVVAALNSVVAVALTAFGSQQHGFGANLVYSQCIGTSIWLLIDGGRLLLRRGERIGARALLLLTVSGTLGGYFFGTLLADLLTGGSTAVYWAQAPRSAIGVLLMSISLGALGVFYFSSRETLAQARARAEAAQRQASEARLRLLEAQLEPHMLFNTLANLRVLIAADPPAAQRMLDRLIAFLRATLAASRTGSHSMAAEFERLRDYLELMAIRMGNRLRYRLDLPEELAVVPVPALLLQPLVENAIRHGLEPKVEGGSVTVAARREGDTVRLVVDDDGLGLDASRDARSTREGSGFGLEQVRERLATAFGPAAHVRAEAGPGGGTRISLTLPLTT